MSRRLRVAALPLVALLAALAPSPVAAPAPPPSATPPPRRNIAGPGDYGIRQQLVHILGKDPDLSGEKFVVVLVNGGAVFSGEIKSCALKTRALRLAAYTRGVINVTDEMRVARADLPDEALRKAVAAVLEGQAEPLGLKELSVRVEDAAATLEGTVKDFPSRVRAEDLAGSVLGVTRIANHLVPSDVPTATDDASLTRAVIAYLSDFRRFGQACDLRVKTEGGAVALSGRVTYLIARQEAAVLASLVRGVRRVDNHIKVDPGLLVMSPGGGVTTIIREQS